MGSIILFVESIQKLQSKLDIKKFEQNQETDNINLL